MLLFTASPKCWWHVASWPDMTNYSIQIKRLATKNWTVSRPPYILTDQSHANHVCHQASLNNLLPPTFKRETCNMQNPWQFQIDLLTRTSIEGGEEEPTPWSLFKDIATLNRSKQCKPFRIDPSVASKKCEWG